MASIKFPQEMPDAPSVVGNDKIMMADAVTSNAKSVSFDKIKDYLTISNVYLDPIASGALPTPMTGQIRLMNIIGGVNGSTWTHSTLPGGSVSLLAYQIAVLYWNGSSWNLRNVQNLPTTPVKNTAGTSVTDAISQNFATNLSLTKEDISNKSNIIDNSISNYPSNRAVYDYSEPKANKSSVIDISNVKFPTNASVRDYVLNTVQGSKFGGVISSSFNLNSTESSTWYYAKPGVYNIPTIGTIELTSDLSMITLSSSGFWRYEDLSVKITLDFLVLNNVNELRNMTPMEIQFLNSGVVKGVNLLGYYTKGDTPKPINYYLYSGSDSDDGGSVFEINEIKLRHKFDTITSYRYFGAKLDGVTDDFVSINNAHKYANKNIIYVNILEPTEIFFTGIIDVKTNTNLSNCNIKITDIIKTQRYNIIEDIDFENITITPEIQSSLVSDIGVLSVFNNKDLNFYVINSDETLGVRPSNPPIVYTKKECFTIGANGNIIDGVLQNNYTSGNITIKRKSIYTRAITFYLPEIIVNQNNFAYIPELFRITRNNTTVHISNIEYINFNDSGTIQRGVFLNVRECYSPVIKNSIARNMGNTTIPPSTMNQTQYVVTFYLSTMIKLKDDLMIGGWGAINTEFVKDVDVSNCILNRFDNHFGISNLNVKDLTISGNNGCINIGWGKGKSTIKNIIWNVQATSLANNYSFLDYRCDIGLFYEGDVVVDNVTINVFVPNSQIEVIKYFRSYPTAVFNNPVGINEIGNLSISNVVVNNLTSALGPLFLLRYRLKNDDKYTRTKDINISNFKYYSNTPNDVNIYTCTLYDNNSRIYHGNVLFNNIKSLINSVYTPLKGLYSNNNQESKSNFNIHDSILDLINLNNHYGSSFAIESSTVGNISRSNSIGHIKNFGIINSKVESVRCSAENFYILKNSNLGLLSLDVSTIENFKAEDSIINNFNMFSSNAVSLILAKINNCYITPALNSAQDITSIVTYNTIIKNSVFYSNNSKPLGVGGMSSKTLLRNNTTTGSVSNYSNIYTLDNYLGSEYKRIPNYETYTTNLRPNLSDGELLSIFDSTLNKPIWGLGVAGSTTWRDAIGNIV